MAHAAAKDDADGIVIGDQIVLDDADAAELRRRPSRIDRARAGLWRVAEEAAIQVFRVRADVLEIEGGSGEELALEVEAPLILAGVWQIPRRRNHVRRHDRGDARRMIE